MRTHISIVAARHAAPRDLEALLQACHYDPTGTSFEIPSWDRLDQALVGPEDKAMVQHQDWTTLIDPEFTVAFEGDHLAALSAKNGPVLTMITEDITGICGFGLFENGQKIRSRITAAEQTIEVYGPPLPEERDQETQPLTPDSVIALLARLGYDYHAMRQARPLRVYPLRFSGSPPTHLLAGGPAADA